MSRFERFADILRRMSRFREEHDVRALSVEGPCPKINGLSVENNGDVRLLGRIPNSPQLVRAATGNERDGARRHNADHNLLKTQA
jgi:hypothetical protein